MSPDRRAAPAARVTAGELISAIASLLLLISMFALAWFGTVGTAGRVTGVGLQSSEDAWNGLSILRWPMLLTILVSWGSLVLHANQSEHGTSTDTGRLLLALSVPTAALVVVRVLIDLPDPARVVDQKLGAYLGMLFSVAIALGAWQMVAERRGDRARQPPRRVPAEDPAAPYPSPEERPGDKVHPAARATRQEAES